MGGDVLLKGKSENAGGRLIFRHEPSFLFAAHSL